MPNPTMLTPKTTMQGLEEAADDVGHGGQAFGARRCASSLDEVAGDPVVLPGFAEFGLHLAAMVGRQRAAGAEPAAARRVGGARQVAFQQHAVACRSSGGSGIGIADSSAFV